MALVREASSVTGVNVEASNTHSVHAVSPDALTDKIRSPAGPLELEDKGKSLPIDEELLLERNSCIRRWRSPSRREAVQVLALSIVTTVIILSLLFVSAYQHNSPATLTLVIVVLVDVIVSSMVLSRFTCCSDPENRGTSVYKSVIIDCIVSALFVGLSLSVMAHAVHNLIERRYVSNTRMLIGTLLPTFVFLLLLGLIKMYVSKRSELSSMKSTGVISLVGAKMSIGVFISTVLVHQDPAIWWVDSVFAIVISVSLLIYGSVTIYCIFKGESPGNTWSFTQTRRDADVAAEDEEQMEI